MIYLASPYSSPDPLIMRTRFLLAEQVTASFLRRGVFIYSPIVHCHEIAAKYELPGDFAFWQGYNIDMLRRADSLAVLAIPGWKKSTGVQAEIEFARLAGIPIQAVNDEGFAIAWPE